MISEPVLKKEFSKIQKIFLTKLDYKFDDGELAAIQSEDILPAQLIQAYCKALSVETINDNNFIQLLDFLEVLELCKNLILQSVDKERICKTISLLIANIFFKQSTSPEFFNLAEQLSKFLAEYSEKDLSTKELPTYLAKLYSFLKISTFFPEADASFLQFIDYLKDLANLGVDAYLKEENKKSKVTWDIIICDCLNNYAFSNAVAAKGFIQLTEIYIEEQKLIAATLCLLKANSLTKLDSSKLFKLGRNLIAAYELSNNCELALKICEWLKKNLEADKENIEAVNYALALQHKAAAILKLSSEIKEEKIRVAIPSKQSSSPPKWYQNISLFGKKKNRKTEEKEQSIPNNELKKKKPNLQLSPREEGVIALLEKLTLLQEKNQQNDKPSETYNLG